MLDAITAIITTATATTIATLILILIKTSEWMLESSVSEAWQIWFESWLRQLFEAR